MFSFWACEDLEQLTIVSLEESQSRAVDLVVGNESACIIDEFNELYCTDMVIWGTYSHNNLTFVPSGRVSRVAHSSGVCVVNLESDLFCWGGRYFEEFDMGFHFGAGARGMEPVKVDLGEVIDLSMSYESACAVTTDHELYCWGANAHGSLGVEELPGGPTPQLVLEDVVDVESSGSVTCVITSSRELYCWGFVESFDEDLELALLTNMNVGDVTAMGLGGSNICAVIEEETVWCWDFLVDETTTIDLEGIVDVVTGSIISCVRTVSGEVFCWDTFDQPETANQPVRLDLDGIVSIGINSILYAMNDKGEIFASDELWPNPEMLPMYW